MRIARGAVLALENTVSTKVEDVLADGIAVGLQFRRADTNDWEDISTVLMTTSKTVGCISHINLSS